MINKIKTIYFQNWVGRIAFYCLLAMVSMTFLFFFDKQPSLSELTIHEGLVTKISAEYGTKESIDIKLEIQKNDSKLEQLKYYVSRGDDYGKLLLGLKEKQIKAWVKNKSNVIFQLESGGKKYISYDIRVARLGVETWGMFFYFIFLTLFFSVFTWVRLKKLSSEKQF